MGRVTARRRRAGDAGGAGARRVGAGEAIAGILPRRARVRVTRPPRSSAGDVVSLSKQKPSQTSRNVHESHPTRRRVGTSVGARRTTTTVWEPDLDKLCASVAEMEGWASEEEEDASKQGTKRKRAPRTKGPCEHGVKPRSQCKVCSACPHGKWRSKCKECGGGSFCEHDRRRSTCKECKK